LLLVATLGCFRATNYPDPRGPVYSHPLADRDASRPVPAAGSPFRVVSFNVEFALHVDRAIGALQADPALATADALLLQEMDAPAVERIARALHLNAIYYPSGIHPRYRRDFGCAVLSPWPIEDSRKLVLPHAARFSGLRRAAVSATLRRGDMRVRVYSVHLPSPRGVSGRSRRDQIRALLADAGAADSVVVIGGDFNSRAIGADLAAAGYCWLTREIGPTTRSHAYDHVFARRPAAWPSALVADGAGVAVDRGASDHKPIWAVFRVSR
jgi:endonuclease/exonuclease/phosphatase family metal-dependent hydrolase